MQTAAKIVANTGNTVVPSVLVSRKEETPNGMVEMQHWFRKLAERQGLIPAAAKEDEGPYRTK